MAEMISAGDFRNGVTIEFEGNIYQIIEFQHVKPGKGAAFVRTKLKNIKSGGVVEKTCSICTMMVIFTTSWIRRHTIRFH